MPSVSRSDGDAHTFMILHSLNAFYGVTERAVPIVRHPSMTLSMLRERTGEELLNNMKRYTY